MSHSETKKPTILRTLSKHSSRSDLWRSILFGHINLYVLSLISVNKAQNFLQLLIYLAGAHIRIEEF